MLKSPCVRNCCLNKEDICVGCFRHIDEIVGWKDLKEEDQERVLAQCDARKAALKHHV